jgi:hypothetical protein
MRATPVGISTACFLLTIATAALGQSVQQGRASCGGTTSFRSDTISVVVGEGTLHGTVVIPSRPATAPVVLFFGGSGPIDRDGNVQRAKERNDGLKMLAEQLGNRGIASVRYDRRGIGESASVQPHESNFVFSALVDDGTAWITRLSTDRRFNKVVLAGHSEGSLIAILIAQSGKANGVITLNGPGRPHWQVLHDQLAGKLSSAQLAEADSIIQRMLRQDTIVPVSTGMLALFRPSVQPYLKSLYALDPARELQRLEVPVLIVQGTTDKNVPASEADVLVRSAKRATVARIMGMNHLLKRASDDEWSQYATYIDPSVPLADGLVNAIVVFVCSQTRRH